jgi:hypothetical protein
MMPTPYQHLMANSIWGRVPRSKDKPVASRPGLIPMNTQSKGTIGTDSSQRRDALYSKDAAHENAPHLLVSVDDLVVPSKSESESKRTLVDASTPAPQPGDNEDKELQEPRIEIEDSDTMERAPRQHTLLDMDSVQGDLPEAIVPRKVQTPAPCYLYLKLMHKGFRGPWQDDNVC